MLPDDMPVKGIAGFFRKRRNKQLQRENAALKTAIRDFGAIVDVLKAENAELQQRERAARTIIERVADMPERIIDPSGGYHVELNQLGIVTQARAWLAASE